MSEITKRLTMLIVSEPVLAANNRSEGEGTLQTLQKITTESGLERTAQTGGAVRAAILQNLQDQGHPIWRRRENPTVNNPVGFTYGTNRAPVMAEADPKTPKGFYDEHFGWMVAMSGKAEEPNKQPTDFGVAVAISCAPYLNDTLFRQGHSAVRNKNNLPQLMPFQQETHWTRYQFLISFDLGRFSPEHLRAYVLAFKGLKIGGNHASNLTEINPSLIAWRIHTNGASGLYLGCGVNVPADQPVDTTELMERMRQLGITCRTAGRGQPLTIHEGLEAMLVDAAKKD